MLPILWLALWLSGLQARPASAAQASIQGVVVRAGASAAAAPEGLGGARVELKPGNITVITGTGGSFNFRNLPAGRYTISVTRDGFIPQEDPNRGLTFSGLSVALAAGQTSKVVFPLVPAPVIIGRVVDPHGEPLAAALVRAYHRRYTPYGTQLKIAKKTMTNDMGDFRLFDLSYGAYFVSASYSDRDRASATGKTQLSTNVSKADDGYSTVFYDGAEDLSRAVATRVAPGSDPGMLTLSLSDSARFRIRGQVLPTSSGAKIVLAPRGSDLTEVDYSVNPDANGTFEIRAVSPGSYLLLATAENGAFSSDVVDINITDTDISGVRLVLEQTMSFYGSVFVDRSIRAILAKMHIKLIRSTTEFDQTIDVPISENGDFHFEHVAPAAEYDIAIEPLPPGVFVRSITTGGRNILSGRSRLVPNQFVQIALAQATDDLDVHVTTSKNTAAGIQVVLIPEPLMRRRPDRYITGFTSDTGDLTLTGVPAGRYTAYAFERIEAGSYYAVGYNPGAEFRFGDRAVPVTVGLGGTKSIELKAIPTTETAGGVQ